MFDELNNKVANGGTSAAGRLTANEWNSFIDELKAELERRVKSIIVGGESFVPDDGNIDLGAVVEEVVSAAVTEKQGILTAGTGIDIDENNVISVKPDGNMTRTVTELPSASEAEEGVIYLVPTSTAGTYAQWVCEDSQWESLGNVALSTSVDSAPSESSTIPMQNKVSTALTGYYECSTAAATATKQVTSAYGYSLPPRGGAMKIKMTYANTAASNVKLKIGAETAKTLYYNGAAVTASNTWAAGEIITVFYDGTNYMACNSDGGIDKKLIDYLYGNLRTISLGQNYGIDEAVKTAGNELIKMNKEVRYLTLDETVAADELKTYDGKTYRSTVSVDNFNGSRSGGYQDAEVALGAPAKITLEISRTLADGTLSVNFDGTTYSVSVETTDSSSDVASNIFSALSEVTGWTFAYEEGQNTITATSVEHVSLSNTVFSVTTSADTGVVGVRTLVQNGIADTEEGADDGRPTILQMAISVKVGTINVKIGSAEQTISIADDDDAVDIATNIAAASFEGWTLTNSDEVVTAIANHAAVYAASSVVVTDGVLGVSATKTVVYGGNNSTVCLYDAGNDVWSTIATKAAYAATVWQELTLEGLMQYTEKNSLYKLLLNEKRKLAYILGNHEKRIKFYDENKMGATEALVIVKALLDLKNNASGGGEAESSLSGTITTGNSDSILIIGSSFGAVISSYVIPGKHWTQILDLFSDYIIQNVSADGSSNVDHLMWLRNGRTLPYPGTRFALLVNSENLGGGVNILYQSFVNLANAVKSFGIQPIIGTSHRNGNGFREYHQFFSSQLRKWCKENNTIFMDAGEYTVSSINGGSGYGSHLNERQSPTVAYAYMDALAGIERPRQSLKFFKLRAGTPVTGLDDLMFTDLYERARRFIPTAASTTFTNYALISVILPATANFLEKVSLHLTSPNEVNVYCMDSNASPYPTPEASYTRFHISDECTISAGDKYSYNGTTFTVVLVNTTTHYGEFCDAYCSPALSSAGNVSGTLTKVSGGGSSSVTFNGYGIATMSESGTVTNDIGGHWVAVNDDGNDNYELNERTTKVFYDQVYFLVECDGNFTVNDVYVNWKSTREKTLIRTAIPDFTVNAFNTNAEIITEAKFGASGTTLTKWKDENGNAIVTTSASPTPPGCSSVITVSNVHKMTYTIPKANFINGRAVLEIMARHTQTTVTGTSWDWNKVYVSLVCDTTTTYDYPIGLAWRVVRIPIETIGLVDGFYNTNITIHAERDGMQIAQVSLKYI